MARRAPQPSLSPRMLKHFAVVTCAITVCLALFADGEGQNELGRAVAVQQHEAALAAAAAGEKVKPKFSINNKIRDARRTYVPFAGEGDDGGDYGAPMDSSSGGGGGGGSVGPRPPSRAGADEAARGPVLPGPIAAQLGGAPAAPPKRKGPPAPHRPTQEQLDQLEAMSKQRSGAS